MFVRMSASLKFQRISGYVHVVDMVKNFGNADSMSIAQAIKQAVKNACTKNLHVPHKSEEWHAENTECCTDTYETFTKNVSLLNADAASDEKKAMDILGSDALLVDVPEEHVCRPKIEAVANTFPGILCQHEDKAHASTRLTQRGWAAVPECRDVYARMIGSTTSPTRIIQNSPQWQKTHSDIILGEKIWQGKTVSEMGMAPHRFNSSSKPMIRNVINVRAVCGQAQIIWQTRGASSFEGQSMLAFASWVQTFHLMLLSFMCEGGCETLKVTRTVEPEDADLGDWASCTETFLKTCIVLFEHKRAQFIGFGKYMLDQLKEEIVFRLPNNQIKTLQLPTQEEIDKALGHMVEWTHLTYKILVAEQPHFHIMQTFTSLSLKRDWANLDKHPHGDEAKEFQRNIERICKMVNVCPTEAIPELKELQPLAKHLLDSGTCASEREAWAHSLMMRMNTARRKEYQFKDARQEYNASSAIIDINVGWGISSSGVERLIGVDKETVSTKHRKCMDQSRLNDELEILMATEELLVKTVNDASMLYLKTFGLPRQKTLLRSDVGQKRPRNDEPSEGFKVASEKAFLRNREKEIDGELDAFANDIDLKQIRQEPRVWASTAAANEASFQENKVKNKLMKEAMKTHSSSLMSDELASINDTDKTEYVKK